jgi:hypothetical protein
MHGKLKPPQDESGSGLTFALQALLSRHESFVSESQQEHARHDAKIAQLEAERTTLQTANERIVAENKELLSKLDQLNDSYKVSDNTVKTLEGLLRDTEIEVRRLNGLARRAEELDARVQDMDKQRQDMMRKLADGESESRSTLTRWRESEKRVRQLELEVQKIEWEARLEQDKHEEIVARLERERVLERELGGAEGRLKGAAALQGIESGTGGKVVSHFVRDILQDNAKLQAGIVQMRELLQSSNDEVQNLRQQIIHHQPIDEEEPEDQFSRSVPLDQEAGWDQPSPQQTQREVHVHHHFHAKFAPKSSRTPSTPRPSRRRTVIGTGVLSSPGSSTPSTPTTRPHRYHSSPVVPISLNQPQLRRNRWSVQSSATMPSTVSSLPSSPRSYIFDNNTSIFDRLDQGEESSRPTSPESAAEYLFPVNTKLSADGFETVLEDDSEFFDSSSKENIPPDVEGVNPRKLAAVQDLTPKPSQFLVTSSPIDIPPAEPRPPDPSTPSIDEEEEEAMTPTTVSHIKNVHTQPPSALVQPSSSSNDRAQINCADTVPIAEVEIRPSLHRSPSQDSLVSISGMDIHLAKRPTRIRGNAAYFPLVPSPARTISASQAIASVTDVKATISKRSFSSDTQGPAGRSLQHIAGVPVSPGPSSGTGVTANLGKIVGLGGWVRGRWGVAPTKSIADLRSHITPSASSISSNVKSTPPKPIQRPTLASIGSSSSGGGTGTLSRTPGINQKGAIPGFWLAQTADRYEVKVQPEMIDEEGSREPFAEE